MLQDGRWDKDEYDSFSWQESPPETPNVDPEEISVDILDPTSNIDISQLRTFANLSTETPTETSKLRDFLWNKGDFNIRAWQRSPPHTPYVEAEDISVETFVSSESITTSQFLSDANADTPVAIDAQFFNSLTWDNGSFDNRAWQTSPPEDTFVEPEPITASTLTVLPSVTTVSSISSATVDTLSEDAAIFRGLVWGEGAFNSRGWQTSPPQTQSVKSTDITSSSITASGPFIESVGRTVESKEDISTETLTDEQSIPVGVEGVGKWDIDSFDEFSWQELSPETETPILSDISVSTLVPDESIRIDNISSSVNASTKLADDKELFVDLVWDVFDFGVSAWQKSPPETQYTVLEQLDVTSISTQDVSITPTSLLSDISIQSISGAQAQTFDRLIWDKQSWDESSWQESPPEYPLLAPVAVQADTKNASGSSITLDKSLASVNAETVSVDEEVTFDRLLWDDRNWGVSSWQTSPPEYPPLDAIEVSSSTRADAETSITTAEKITSIDVSTKAVQEEPIFDRLSWDVRSWGASSWQSPSQPFLTTSLTSTAVTPVVTDRHVATTSDTSVLSAASISAIPSTEIVDLVRGRWEADLWDTFDWTTDSASRVDPGTVSDINSSITLIDDTSISQDVGVSAISVGTQASIDIASADDGLTPILEGVSSSSVAAKNASISIDLIKVDTLLSSIQSTDNIEITSALSITSPDTSIASTIVIEDDVASAEDISELSQVSGTPQLLDAETKSVDISSLSAVDIGTQVSTDTSSALAEGTASISAGAQTTLVSITPVSVVTLADILSTPSTELASANEIALPQTVANDSQTAFEVLTISGSTQAAGLFTSETTDALSVAFDEGSITATTATVATIDAITIAEDTGIEDVATLTQQSTETAIAQDADIIGTSDATTPSIDADTSARDADDITTIEETSAIATEAISIALARVESVETSLVASTVSSDGEQTSADSITTPISAAASPQTINAFTASLDESIISTAEALTQQSDDIASAVDEATIQTVAARAQTIDADTVAIDGASVAVSVATSQTIDATSIALDSSIITTAVETPEIDATTSAVDADNIAATVATVTEIDAETRALDQPAVSTFDNSSILIDADTAAQDAATRSTPVASTALIDADTSAQDVPLVAASGITPLQGTDAIEIASSISLIDPQTSVASIIASADEQTTATDASVRDDTNVIVAQIDAFTSSFDPAGSRPVEAESAGIDADTLALDDSNVAESTSTIVDVIDTAVSVDDASRASISVAANVSTEVALAAEIPGVEGVVSTPLSGTDIAEFASAFDISIQSSALAPSIPSFDEDTSAVEVSSVSTTRVDSLLLDAQTTALEEGIVSQQIALTFESIEDTTALEEGLLSGASVASQQTTDEIEITSAISVISPESLDATPIISGDEDTSAFEGGVLSLLKVDDIVVDAGTSSIEEGVISDVLSVEPSPDEISTAQEEGEISISSISVSDTTDEIEITSAISVISPETLTASPIILSDEDTSAFEEGGLSGLLTDAITVNADTSARELPVVSDGSVATGLLDDDVITITSFGLVQDDVVATGLTSFDSIDIIRGKESDIASVQIPANATLEIASALSGIELESATALVTTSIDDRALALDTDIEVSVIATILATGAEDEFAVPAGFASRGSVEFNSANSTTVITQPTRAETL